MDAGIQRPGTASRLLQEYTDIPGSIREKQIRHPWTLDSGIHAGMTCTKHYQGGDMIADMATGEETTMNPPTDWRIPYGVADFVKLRTRGHYFVDKTQFLPRLEQTGEFLFLIRPRRFGNFSRLKAIIEQGEHIGKVATSFPVEAGKLRFVVVLLRSAYVCRRA